MIKNKLLKFIIYGAVISTVLGTVYNKRKL